MFFIFIANFLATELYWYSLIWYFDMIMHFLGGLWVGLFFFYVFSYIESVPKFLILAFEVLIATLVIGLLWELYEYVLNVISLTPWDIIDTSSDVFFDLFGSFVSIFYFLKIIMPISINKIQLDNDTES